MNYTEITSLTNQQIAIFELLQKYKYQVVPMFMLINSMKAKYPPEKMWTIDQRERRRLHTAMSRFLLGLENPMLEFPPDADEYAVRTFDKLGYALTPRAGRISRLDRKHADKITHLMFWFRSNLRWFK